MPLSSSHAIFLSGRPPRSSFCVLRQYAARGTLHEESFVAVNVKFDILVRDAWDKFGNV